MSQQPYDAAREAASRISELSGVPAHDALVVLGSGWGTALESFGEPVASFAMTDVSGFLAPVAVGHLGEIRSYDLDGVATLAFLGRTHLYEGHGIRPVVHGIRSAAAAGIQLAVLTNANGSLRSEWELGQPVLVSDHLNLTAVSPLDGARFVDLTHAWSPRLRDLARSIDPSLQEGVYAQLAGPHYETAAEAEWLRRVGADMIGMSTVQEAIAARELDVELLGVSTVTAIEGTEAGIDPSEVVVIAEQTARRMGPMLVELVRKGVQR